MAGFYNLGILDCDEDEDAQEVKTRLVTWDGKDLFLLSNGQMIYERDESNFLGGGAFGSVYKYEDVITRNPFAIKQLRALIMHPPPQIVKKTATFFCVKQGIKPTDEQVKSGCINRENISWYYRKTLQSFVAAYEDRNNVTKEINLCMCMHLFGLNPFGELMTEDTVELNERRGETVCVNGVTYSIPMIPPSYIKFLKEREELYKEIKNMAIVSGHSNIVSFVEMLECVDTLKTTFFIVQEFVDGGTLNKFIESVSKVTTLTELVNREFLVKKFFRQLLLGLQHCHGKGIAHRDLKCENVLLTSFDESGLLKICDFGFSKTMFKEINSGGDLGFSSNRNSLSDSSSSNSNSKSSCNNGIDTTIFESLEGIDLQDSPSKSDSFDFDSAAASSPSQDVRVFNVLSRLQSVLGTPTYRSPEIHDLNGDGKVVGGYIGSYADMWSAGVILYVLITGCPPFGEDVNNCSFFDKFKSWCKVDDEKAGEDASNRDYPYLFRIYGKDKNPISFPPLLSDLLLSLLHPEPSRRLSAAKALAHPWFSDVYISRQGEDYNRAAGSRNNNNNYSTEMNAEEAERQNRVAILASAFSTEPSNLAIFDKNHRWVSNEKNHRAWLRERDQVLVIENESDKEIARQTILAFPNSLQSFHINSDFMPKV